MMKKLRVRLLFVCCLVLYSLWSNASSIQYYFQEKISDVQVQGAGKVVRVLSDDTQGSRHQRFILELETGLRVLIAHNIDLAPRLPELKIGDRVEFYGEYEWNNKGGVIHWTHKDPKHLHEHGWLKFKGRIFD